MNLKKLEWELLEQVYNAVLNIPDTVVVSIPHLKKPSVLVELKRMRQKIKNKMKIGKTRLMNDCPKQSTSSSNDIYDLENQSQTCFVSEFDTSNNFQHDKQLLNNSKYESDTSNNSKSRISCNRTSEFNDSNTNANKWFDNHSDFQANTTSLSRQTSNYDNIYSRERLSVNQLDCIVNDNNFDFITDSDIQKSIQSCSTTNNRLDAHTSLESNKLPSQKNEGKMNDMNVHIILLNGI